MRTRPSRLLHRAELLFVVRGAVMVTVLGLVALAAGFSRWSPLGMDSAANLAAAGDTAGAVHAYIDLARRATDARTRETAAWRAAWLASIDDAHPQQAIELLRAYADAHPRTARAAVAHARLATLYRLYLEDPVRAAESWQAAALAAPDADDVGQWQLEAGLAFLDAGLPDRAAAALDEASGHDDTFVAAQLALGRLRLLDDPAAAYDHYTLALGRARSDADRSLARLGIASALEGLDRVGQALAELEDTDDDPALQRRRARLQARGHR